MLFCFVALFVCAHFIAVEPLPVFSLANPSSITNPYNSTQSINTSPQQQQQQLPPPLPPMPPTPTTPTTRTDLFRQSVVKTISPKRVTIINDDTEYVLNNNAQLSYINYNNSINNNNNTPSDNSNHTNNNTSFNNSFNNEIQIDIDRSFNKGIKNSRTAFLLINFCSFFCCC